jgi:hypothetical protein
MQSISVAIGHDATLNEIKRLFCLSFLFEDHRRFRARVTQTRKTPDRPCVQHRWSFQSREAEHATGGH